MYSAALTDPDVRALVAKVQPGSRIMPVQYSASLGGGGGVVSLPIRTSTGITTAYIIYGRTADITSNGLPDTVPVRIMVRSDGTFLSAQQGRAETVPPEYTAALEPLYMEHFPDEYIDRRIAVIANERQTRQPQAAPAAPAAAEQAEPMAWRPPTREQCFAEHRTRMQGLLPLRARRNWMLGGAAVTIIVSLTVRRLSFNAEELAKYSAWMGFTGAAGETAVGTSHAVTIHNNTELFEDLLRRCLAIAVG
jgi:hypothetical protein